MLARIVTRLGHEAESCTDAAEAQQKGLLGGYDVILSDYVMNPNGIEVLRAFEHHDCYRVLLTASYATSEISDALLHGVIHVVLTKPAILSDLRSVLCAAAFR